MESGTYNIQYSGKCVSGKHLNIGQLVASLNPPTAPSQTAAASSISPSDTSTASTAPANGPKPKMRTVLQMFPPSYDSSEQWWYSWVEVKAVDAATNQPIAGATFTGRWSISPDNDWSVDYWAGFPSSVLIETRSFTNGWTDSEWIPTASTAKAFWPKIYAASYAGARATFTLQSAEHLEYEWDRAESRRSTGRAFRVSSRKN